MDIARFPLSEVPEEGLLLEGELPAGVFELAPDDARPVSPLVYHLRIVPHRDFLHAEGAIHAEFELECCRCLERFPFAIRIDPYDAEVEPDEKDQMIHLTDRLREDILLALPAYPHCDQGNEARECPVADRFSSPLADDAEVPGNESDNQPGRVWDVLEQWKPKPPND